MDQLQTASVLAELIDQLRANGSWGGETHVQKAAYFLQEVLGVPLGVEYILYKHGPYSFDVAERLVQMRANFLIEKEYVKEGYGPQLRTTEESRTLRARYPKTLALYSPQIQFITSTLGSKGVGELEKLTTALWVSRELGEKRDVERRAIRLNELKPHVTIADARVAVEAFDELTQNASNVSVSEHTTNSRP